MGELTRRIAFTVGILLVYRLGCYIPIPGIDWSVWQRIFTNSQDGALGAANAVSGGAIARLSIFALGLTPYVAAAVLIQVASVASAKLLAVPRRGEAGRRAIVGYTLVLTLVIAIFQGFGVASGLQQIDNLVVNPGPLFVATTVLSFAGGALLLVWLSGQITQRGIGNGISVLLLAGVALEVPRAIAAALQLNNLGVFSVELTIGLALLGILLVFAISFVERSRLLLPLQFAARKLEGRVIGGRESILSLKINNAGVIPAVVAPWFFYLPLTVLAFVVGSEVPWLRTIIQQMQLGQPGHMIFNSVVMIVLVFVYTASIIDPDHIAEQLKTYGGVIPGIAPGDATADQIDRSVSRVTVVGALYLALVYLIPELLLAYAKVPFYLGGASALIAVGAVLDIDAQVRGLISPVKAGD